jgi:uncharacterized membrane protein YuzA (DUF378 family)
MATATPMTTASGSGRRGWPSWLVAPTWGLGLFALTLVEMLVGALALTAAGLSMTVIGLAAVPVVLPLMRGTADLGRRLAGRWGPPIESPYRPLRRDSRWIGLRAVATERATWRDLLWLIIDPIVGGTLALVPAALVAYGVFGATVQPFVWAAMDRAGGSNWYTAVHVQSTTTALVCVPIGVALIAIGLRLGPPILRRHAAWTRRLLGASG